MHAEIISIGSELTSGAKLDTNSQWLSLQLSEIGIPVYFHSTMADDPAAMLEVFQTAVARSDVVLITGGLGPTLDDLTRELIGQLLNTELVLHEPSLKFIEELFASRNREMPERNRIQAMFPVGTEPIENPIGTAPGIWAEIKRDGLEPCLVAAMPGVPSEMRKMYREQVQSRLPFGSRVIRRTCIHCFGQGESNIEEMLGELTARDRNPEVGITASAATITLRIAAHGSTAEECDRLLSETRQQARETLGDLVFGGDDYTLESAVCRLLVEYGKTLSTVESGSRGMLAHMLAVCPEAEQCCVGSLVVTGPVALNEPISPADVSRQMAVAMVQNCMAEFGSDFALAVTPFSTPDDEGVSRGFVAMIGDDRTVAVEHRLLGDPALAGPRASKTALNLLRLHLLRSIPDSQPAC